jgi:hypothetical protein
VRNVSYGIAKPVKGSPARETVFTIRTGNSFITVRFLRPAAGACFAPSYLTSSNLLRRSAFFVEFLAPASLLVRQPRWPDSRAGARIMPHILTATPFPLPNTVPAEADRGVPRQSPPTRPPPRRQRLMCPLGFRWRSRLFVALTLMLGALPASPGRAQMHLQRAHPGVPVLSGSLSIFFGGPGGGNVPVSEAHFPVLGFACASDCTRTFSTFGSPVVLRATSDAASVFAGWGGACGGAGATCEVTLSRSTPVIAYFRPNRRVVSAGAYHTCDMRPALGDMVC